MFDRGSVDRDVQAIAPFLFEWTMVYNKTDKAKRKNICTTQCYVFLKPISLMP